MNIAALLLLAMSGVCFGSCAYLYSNRDSDELRASLRSMWSERFSDRISFEDFLQECDEAFYRILSGGFLAGIAGLLLMSI